MRAHRSLLALALATPFALLAGSASAHLDLVSPTPRLAGQTGGSQLKTKPCGQTSNARTTDKVTTFAPGQKVEVKIKEYIDHPGYFAVAFDPDGDDSFPFPAANSTKVNPDTDDPKAQFPINDKVLGLRLDKEKNCATENADKTCTISITLPNVTCQNCTLQVIQFMYDKLGDTADNEYYYQCADIKIEGTPAGGSGGTGAGGSAGASTGGASAGGMGGASAGGMGGASAGGMGGASTAGSSAVAGAATGGGPIGPSDGGAPTGTAGTASSTAGTGSPAGGVTSVPPTSNASTADDSSCSFTKPTRGAASLASLLGLAFALGYRRRRASNAS